MLVYVAVALWLCCSAASGEEPRPATTATRQNAAEGKVWKLELNISFARQLPEIVQKPARSDFKMRCEAVLNFTRIERHGEQIPLSEVPRQYLVAFSRNVKLYWLRRNATLLNDERVSVRPNASDFTVAATLRIHDLRTEDEGPYTCVIENLNFEKRSTLRLEVTGDDDSEGELPMYKPLFPESQTTSVSAANPPSTVHRMVVAAPKTTASSMKYTKKIEPICQKYIGKQCSRYLKSQYVYIPHTTTQDTLELKLANAFRVTQQSTDISTNCEGYAVPSLCFSTFPICRNPSMTNEMFFREASLIIPLDNKLPKTHSSLEVENESPIVFPNMPASGLPHELDPNLSDTGITKPLSNVSLNPSLDRFNYRYNATILRRVCKQDCEILENELCQTEYAIAKRHPHIGQQLTLEDCQDLPQSDPDCLTVGIPAPRVSEDDCYWENGVGYLGKMNTSNSGAPCIMWSQQLYVKLREHLELAGQHNYCRNPGGRESQPWCFIDRDGMQLRQICDIPKCSHKIWMYIIIVFLALIIIFSSLLVCLCCMNKNKQNATTIRDINLPNADKNIYGNSRLNSPIELNDLLHQQSQSNSRPRGNGVLRVPQYTLSQIKFLEELGEGAFGKVYKGALSRGGDTLFVAVKALKENASAKTKADFRREIELISELRHENIVCIVGVALREEPLCMLFEFMARGDLHEFLMGRAPPAGKGLPAARLLSIACHVARGMQYLAAHHYVHRDLAARNCLVADDFVVKISDFGLSRDIYSSDYYRVQSKSLLPVRWMPPESILYGKFTSESDIWSYGVVLWEIYSYGLQPYYGYSNQEVISMVRGGELLASPAGCPPLIYSLMRDCWRHTPQRRPHFEDIAGRLQAWMEQGGCGCSEGGSSESSAAGAAALGAGDPRERAPLLPARCSSSDGSLTSAGRRTGPARAHDDARSTCSDAPARRRSKKGSCGSLAEERRDTVVRIHAGGLGNDI